MSIDKALVVECDKFQTGGCCRKLLQATVEVSELSGYRADVEVPLHASDQVGQKKPAVSGARVVGCRSRLLAVDSEVDAPAATN